MLSEPAVTLIWDPNNLFWLFSSQLKQVYWSPKQARARIFRAISAQSFLGLKLKDPCFRSHEQSFEATKKFYDGTVVTFFVESSKSLDKVDWIIPKLLITDGCQIFYNHRLIWCPNNWFWLFASRLEQNNLSPKPAQDRNFRTISGSFGKSFVGLKLLGPYFRSHKLSFQAKKNLIWGR